MAKNLAKETGRSKDHLLSLPLWQNSLIRINNTPVLYTDWLLKGITQVKHLMDDSHNFMSLESFQNKYELHVKPLSLFGIFSAVKLLQRQIPKTQLKHESLFDTFLKSQKSSRIVYQKLISDKGERPLSCQEKWHIKILVLQMKLLTGEKSIKHLPCAQGVLN